MPQGEVDLVIKDLLATLEDGSLSRSKASQLKGKVVRYSPNNRHRMAYADHLCNGLSIAPRHHQVHLQDAHLDTRQGLRRALKAERPS